MLEIFDKVFGGNNANVDSLRESIEDNKQHVNDELAYYKSVAKDVLKAKKKVENASAAYSKRESAKNASKLDDAKQELESTLEALKESERQIKNYLNKVRDDYLAISGQYRGRKAERFMDAYQKYHSSINSRMIDIQSNIDTEDYFVSNIEEEETPMAIPEIPVVNAAPAPAQAPAPQQAPAAPAYATPAYQYPQYIPVPMPMPGYYPQQAPQ